MIGKDDGWLIWGHSLTVNDCDLSVVNVANVFEVVLYALVKRSSMLLTKIIPKNREGSLIKFNWTVEELGIKFARVIFNVSKDNEKRTR